MSGTDTAAMVPDVYDVVIDGFGYVTARAVDPNLPFRTQQQNLSYSPTFVERQNVSNAYGDNAQDFFLTARQRDWSLGEQQKFFRAGQDGRYWMGQNIDVSTPGQVRLAPTVTSLGFAQTVVGGAKEGQRHTIVVGGSANLYRVGLDGTITDLGAHGVGTTPARYGVASDGLYNYLTATAASGGVRKWDQTVFSAFSASSAACIEFLNNTLYGYQSSTGSLIRFDAAGVASTVFTWKGADGTATGGTICRLTPFGGKLLILFAYGQEASELWIYDGTSPSRLEVLPENFVASDMEVLYGVVYISGSFMKTKSGSTTDFYPKPAVLFFDGTIGKLWEANDFSTTAMTGITTGPHPTMGVSNGRLIFTDETVGNIMSYNPATGGVSTIGTFTPSTGTETRFVSTGLIQVHTRTLTTGYLLPAATYPTSGYAISSLIDFDSSLSKVFRGVTVEFEAASDGNGGTVDVAYQLNSLAGSYTSLSTGVTSGTEVAFPANTTGHSVSIKVTVNKGTSTAGPTLKSLSVRGAPTLPPYRLNQFILDLGGDTGQQAPVRRRDDSDHTLTGEEMRVNLAATITTQTPVSVTDRTGTYTAMPEPANCEFDLTRPGQWYAQIRLREV